MSDLPKGEFEVKIGNSFSKSALANEYHSVRYDFKPASVAEDEAETYISLGENNSVGVAVPKTEKGKREAQDLTLFRGSKKPATEKDCLLIFDHDTNQFRLEKLTSQINLKKTRKDPNAQHILESINRTRSGAVGASANAGERLPMEGDEDDAENSGAEEDSNNADNSSDDSSNSSKSDSDSSEDDDELEEVKPEPGSRATSEDSHAKSHNKPPSSTPSTLHDDLLLSDSDSNGE